MEFFSSTITEYLSDQTNKLSKHYEYSVRSKVPQLESLITRPHQGSKIGSDTSSPHAALPRVWSKANDLAPHHYLLSSLELHLPGFALSLVESKKRKQYFGRWGRGAPSKVRSREFSLDGKPPFLPPLSFFCFFF